MHDKPQLDNCNYKFTQLKVVVLRSFKYLSSELELVKILFHRAINLERLELIPPKAYSLCKFKKEDTLTNIRKSFLFLESINKGRSKVT